MDRLKLETVYLHALDALMSAVDEYQIQAAIFRLRRAQARLHGWEVQGLQLSIHTGGERPSRFTYQCMAVSRQMSIGDFWRRMQPSAPAIRQQKQPSSSPDHSGDFGFVSPNRRKWT